MTLSEACGPHCIDGYCCDTECGDCGLESQHDGPCWWPGMNTATACCVEFARAGLDHEQPCTYLDGGDE